MPETFIFTSESVNEGHPDKLCDQVSDAILDACLKQDPEAKVACETATKTGMIMVFGEINTTAKLDVDAIVRECVKNIGYDAKEKGLDYKTVEVINRLEQQSAEIANCVFVDKTIEDIGAGDQGIMFGYASNESEDFMPLTASLATRLGKKLTEVRKDGTIPYLRPDGKTQISIEFSQKDGNLKPVRIHTIVISTQHDADVSLETIRKDLLELVIKPVCPAHLIDENTVYHLNPSGSFVVGGPEGDAGLTGRKIIVDTYGGWGAHGGGAFSGKDPTKVDRSAAYAARWIAKSLVAAGLCQRVIIQLSYAIGVANPLSIHVDSYGTASKCGYTDVDLIGVIKKNFDLRPGCILRDLDLKKPIYLNTAAYGHFGREGFSWEQPKKLELEGFFKQE